MQLVISDKTHLTPDSAEKAIFYLTLTLPEKSEELLQYEPGDWLTVQAFNREELVQDILQLLALNGTESIELRRVGGVTVFDALLHHLEITQLNPAILNKMQRQLQIGQWDDRQAMMDFSYGRDIVDLLHGFPELQKMGLEFFTLLSPLAPRYYSIASANRDDRTVSILYRQVHYEREARARHGVATHHLTQLKKGDCVEAEVKHNPTFKMPASLVTPMIMIGAGTGLAPYISFLQAREKLVNEHKADSSIGEAYLFFGEMTQQHHCLLCDELNRWQDKGLVKLVTAFSRDQSDKVYIQHRLLEKAAQVFELLKAGGHLYICGSQTRLAVGVKQFLLQIFEQQGKMTAEQAQDYWNQLRKEKRLQQDIY